MLSTELRKVVPNENCYRRYRISQQKLLFGGFDLVLEWGRIGSATRSKSESCSSLEVLERKRKAILEKRFKHGYSLKTR